MGTRGARPLAALMGALVVLLVGSVVSPLGAHAASPTPGPGAPGPHTGARSSPVHAPSARVPVNASVSASVTCDGGFDAVASPSSTNHNYLVSTSAVSANDVWAVGNTSNIGVAYDRTLAEHWDGNSWTIIPTSNPGAYHNDLTGVVAISTNDVWVSGFYVNDASNSTYVAYTQHWNGSSWSGYVLAPTAISLLFAITAVSSTDVWAVGTFFSAGTFEPWVEHWNGASWSLIPVFNANSFDNELFAVSASSSTDVWVVGESTADSVSPSQSLAEHWNGSTWSLISSPNTIGDNSILWVDALETGHAVGVGFGNFVSGSTPRQSESWDLLATGVSTNNASLGTGLGTGDNALIGVARSGGSVWAVGYSRATISSPRQTLVIPATWDSAGHTLAWGAAPGISASPGATNSVLEAVTAVSPYAFWATGYENNATTFDQTLAESYCARHFSLTAPASTTIGAPFSLVVTAANGDGTTVTGYRGTVHFTSSDPSATLPANYTFTPGDNGVHTFAGAVLRTPGNQTITVADIAMPFTLPGSATLNVPCVGACPGPAGTPGARGANPGPAGTPGTRAANQSGAGTGGPRLPLQSSDTATTAGLATGLESQPGNVAPAAASTTPRLARAIDEVAGPETISPPVQAPAQHATVLVARTDRVVPPPDQIPWDALLLIPLLACTLVLVELRRRQARRD